LLVDKMKVDDVSVSTMLAARTTREAQRAVGNYLNPVAIRVVGAAGIDTDELLGRVRASFASVLRYCSVSALDIALYVPEATEIYGNPSHIWLLFQVAREVAETELRLPGVAVEPLDPAPVLPDESSFPQDLNFTVFRRGDQLRVDVTYNAALFEPTTIERIVTAYEECVKAVLVARGV
jgi:hypothetical protein